MKKRTRDSHIGRLREPGFWETMLGLLFGAPKALDCIQVEVSSRCPGHCTYCPHTIDAAQWHSQDMTMETFASLLPLFRHSHRVHLQGWGEPLLNPNLLEMAALAHEAGCAVSTTTCGLLMDRPMASALVGSDMDIIAFSLAGTDRESNSSRRGVDFERVCRAISLLQSERSSCGDSSLQIHIAYLMLASNMPAVQHLPELMQSLGVQAAVISSLDYIAHPAWASEGIAPHEAEKLKEAATILKETAARAETLGLGFHWGLPGPDPGPGTCRENVLRSLFVGADGSVSPCVFVNLPISHHRAEENHLVFGNVNDSNPVEIWESDGYRRYRSRFAQGDVDHPCITCVKRFESLV